MDLDEILHIASCMFLTILMIYIYRNFYNIPNNPTSINSLLSQTGAFYIDNIHKNHDVTQSNIIISHWYPILRNIELNISYINNYISTSTDTIRKDVCWDLSFCNNMLNEMFIHHSIRNSRNVNIIKFIYEKYVLNKFENLTPQYYDTLLEKYNLKADYYNARL